MRLQLFNSLENKLSNLLINPQKTVNVYLCGPTVYDHVHLGNLRPVITFDVLFRLLLVLGVKVNYVQNITDVDDKIIAKAQQEKSTEKKIANRYTKAYLTNLLRYNVLFPNHFPRVSNHIDDIQDFITQLVKKDCTYQTDKEVLFRVFSRESYGKLSGQNLVKLRAKSREFIQADKKDDKDFVL